MTTSLVIRHAKAPLIAPRGAFRRYAQATDSVEPVSLDCTDYLDEFSLTATAMAAHNVDTGLTVGSELFATDTWSALLSATEAADYKFELWTTFSDGTKQVLRYVVRVN